MTKRQIRITNILLAWGLIMVKIGYLTGKYFFDVLNSN